MRFIATSYLGPQPGETSTLEPKATGEVLILCPTRDRPDDCLELLRSVEQSTQRAKVAFYVDRDQRELYADLPEASERSLVMLGDRVGPCASLNALVQRFSGFDAYGMLPDDSTLEGENVDGRILAALDLFPNTIGVVSLAHTQGLHVDHAFVSRRWLDVVGWYATPKFYAWCYNTVFDMLGQSVMMVHFDRLQGFVRHLPKQSCNEQHMAHDTKAYWAWTSNMMRPLVDALKAEAAR